MAGTPWQRLTDIIFCSVLISRTLGLREFICCSNFIHLQRI